MSRRVLLLGVLIASAVSGAFAAAKDESAVDWFPLPQWTNDWRASLADKGIALGATYIIDNIGNASGGMKRGAINFGRLDLGVDADLEKLVGWAGAKAHANVFAIYGHGLSRCCVGNLATISEIEALPDVRLYEAYIEQTLLNGALSIKVGQQAADVEFFDSQTDDLFVNGTFGWPAIKATGLPAGGPSPPIAVPGIRIKAQPTENFTAFAAIFNGDPARPGAGDPQRRDDHGLAFRLKDPPWIIGQVRWDYSLDIAGMRLPGNITPGAWHHFGNFNDQRWTAEGISLVDPAGSGIPARRRGNDGLFVVFEQTLYRPPSSNEPRVSASVPGVTAFTRVAYSPPDRNLIELYVDGGVSVSGLVPRRPQDRFGVAVAYMQISGDARALDSDNRALFDPAYPIRSNETLLELIYEAHIKPGWMLAPYFQYVWRPSGGIPNPLNPTSVARIGDAAVFGLTSTFKF